MARTAWRTSSVVAPRAGARSAWCGAQPVATIRGMMAWKTRSSALPSATSSMPPLPPSTPLTGVRSSLPPLPPRSLEALPVLLVGDRAQPLGLAEADREVQEIVVWLGAVPVLLAGSDVHHVPRGDDTAVAVAGTDAALPVGDDEHLSAAVAMPVGPRLGLD